MEKINYSEISHIGLLLHDLDKSKQEDKIKILQTLGLLLTSKNSMKVEFNKQGGIHIILKYLQDKEWKIAGAAFSVIQMSMSQNLENKLALTTEHVFKLILKILKQGKLNRKKSAMYLIANIVDGNALGQELVRESGCLHLLIQLFHDAIETLSSTEENESQFWHFLCIAIKTCVYNPQNFQNQHQTSLIIPKAVTVLGSWFNEVFNKNFSDNIQMLISLLVAVMNENPTNQFSFSTYSGMQTVLRGISLLDHWQDAPPNIAYVQEKLVSLLDAAVYNSHVNCEQAATHGVIPLLLNLLAKFSDQHKLSLLMALTHLVEGSTEIKKQFLKLNGITSVVVATVNLEEDSKAGVAANLLLKLVCVTKVQQGRKQYITESYTDQVPDEKYIQSSSNNVRFDKEQHNLNKLNFRQFYNLNKSINKEVQTEKTDTEYPFHCSSINEIVEEKFSEHLGCSGVIKEPQNCISSCQSLKNIAISNEKGQKYVNQWPYISNNSHHCLSKRHNNIQNIIDTGNSQPSLISKGNNMLGSFENKNIFCHSSANDNESIYNHSMFQQNNSNITEENVMLGSFENNTCHHNFTYNNNRTQHDNILQQNNNIRKVNGPQGKKEQIVSDKTSNILNIQHDFHTKECCSDDTKENKNSNKKDFLKHRSPVSVEKHFHHTGNIPVAQVCCKTSQNHNDHHSSSLHQFILTSDENTNPQENFVQNNKLFSYLDETDPQINAQSNNVLLNEKKMCIIDQFESLHKHQQQRMHSPVKSDLSYQRMKSNTFHSFLTEPQTEQQIPKFEVPVLNIQSKESAPLLNMNSANNIHPEVINSQLSKPVHKHIKSNAHKRNSTKSSHSETNILQSGRHSRLKSNSTSYAHSIANSISNRCESTSFLDFSEIENNTSNCLAHSTFYFDRSKNQKLLHNCSSQDIQIPFRSLKNNDNKERHESTSILNVTTEAKKNIFTLLPGLNHIESVCQEHNMNTVPFNGENNLQYKPLLNAKRSCCIEMGDENASQSQTSSIRQSEHSDYSNHKIKISSDTSILSSSSGNKNKNQNKNSMLRYSKRELDNLVAGVSKYGLDFKAIRRAYTFDRKRTAKDLYQKWRNSFIKSNTHQIRTDPQLHQEGRYGR